MAMMIILTMIIMKYLLSENLEQDNRAGHALARCNDV